MCNVYCLQKTAKYISRFCITAPPIFRYYTLLLLDASISIYFEAMLCIKLILLCTLAAVRINCIIAFLVGQPKAAFFRRSFNNPPTKFSFRRFSGVADEIPFATANVNLYNKILNQCAQYGDESKAEKIIEQMTKADIPPNEKTFEYLALAWIKSNNEASSEEASAIVDQMLKSGFRPPYSLCVYLIQLYGSKGYLSKVEGLFDRMMYFSYNPSVDMFNAYLSAQMSYSSSAIEAIQKCEEIFDRMVFTGVEPNIESYEVLFQVLSLDVDGENNYALAKIWATFQQFQSKFATLSGSGAIETVLNAYAMYCKGRLQLAWSERKISPTHATFLPVAKTSVEKITRLVADHQMTPRSYESAIFVLSQYLNESGMTDDVLQLMHTLLQSVLKYANNNTFHDTKLPNNLTWVPKILSTLISACSQGTSSKSFPLIIEYIGQIKRFACNNHYWNSMNFEPLDLKANLLTVRAFNLYKFKSITETHQMISNLLLTAAFKMESNDNNESCTVDSSTAKTIFFSDLSRENLSGHWKHNITLWNAVMANYFNHFRTTSSHPQKSSGNTLTDWILSIYPKITDCLHIPHYSALYNMHPLELSENIVLEKSEKAMVSDIVDVTADFFNTDGALHNNQLAHFQNISSYLESIFSLVSQPSPTISSIRPDQLTYLIMIAKNCILDQLDDAASHLLSLTSISHLTSGTLTTQSAFYLYMLAMLKEFDYPTEAARVIKTENEHKEQVLRYSPSKYRSLYSHRERMNVILHTFGLMCADLLQPLNLTITTELSFSPLSCWGDNPNIPQGQCSSLQRLVGEYTDIKKNNHLQEIIELDGSLFYYFDQIYEQISDLILIYKKETGGIVNIDINQFFQAALIVNSFRGRTLVRGETQENGIGIRKNRSSYKKSVTVSSSQRNSKSRSTVDTVKPNYGSKNNASMQASITAEGELVVANNAFNVNTNNIPLPAVISPLDLDIHTADIKSCDFSGSRNKDISIHDIEDMDLYLKLRKKTRKQTTTTSQHVRTTDFRRITDTTSTTRTLFSRTLASNNIIPNRLSKKRRDRSEQKAILHNNENKNTANARTHTATHQRNAADQALQIIQRMQIEAGCAPDLESYRRLLYALEIGVEDKPQSIPTRALEVLQHMIATQIQPDLSIFATVMSIWVKSRRSDSSRVVETIYQSALAAVYHHSSSSNINSDIFNNDINSNDINNDFNNDTHNRTTYSTKSKRRNELILLHELMIEALVKSPLPNAVMRAETVFRSAMESLKECSIDIHASPRMHALMCYAWYKAYARLRSTNMNNQGGTSPQFDIPHNDASEYVFFERNHTSSLIMSHMESAIAFPPVVTTAETYDSMPTEFPFGYEIAVDDAQKRAEWYYSHCNAVPNNLDINPHNNDEFTTEDSLKQQRMNEKKTMESKAESTILQHNLTSFSTPSTSSLESMTRALLSMWCREGDESSLKKIDVMLYDIAMYQKPHTSTPPSSSSFSSQFPSASLSAPISKGYFLPHPSVYRMIANTWSKKGALSSWVFDKNQTPLLQSLQTHQYLNPFLSQPKHAANTSNMNTQSQPSSPSSRQFSSTTEKNALTTTPVSSFVCKFLSVYGGNSLSQSPALQAALNYLYTIEKNAGTKEQLYMPMTLIVAALSVKDNKDLVQAYLQAVETFFSSKESSVDLSTELLNDSAVSFLMQFSLLGSSPADDMYSKWNTKSNGNLLSKMSIDNNNNGDLASVVASSPKLDIVSVNLAIEGILSRCITLVNTASSIMLSENVVKNSGKQTYYNEVLRNTIDRAVEKSETLLRFAEQVLNCPPNDFSLQLMLRLWGLSLGVHRDSQTTTSSGSNSAMRGGGRESAMSVNKASEDAAIRIFNKASLLLELLDHKLISDLSNKNGTTGDIALSKNSVERRKALQNRRQSYSVFIEILGRSRNPKAVQQAVRVLDQMKRSLGLSPDGSVYASLIESVAAASLPESADHAEYLFQEMIEKGFRPSLRTCRALLHVLCYSFPSESQSSPQTRNRPKERVKFEDLDDYAEAIAERVEKAVQFMEQRQLGITSFMTKNDVEQRSKTSSTASKEGRSDTIINDNSGSTTSSVSDRPSTGNGDNIDNSTYVESDINSSNSGNNGNNSSGGSSGGGGGGILTDPQVITYVLRAWRRCAISSPVAAPRAEHLFNRALRAGLRPTVSLFNMLIGIQCRAGDSHAVYRAEQSLLSMTRDYNLTPNLISYNMIIAALGGKSMRTSRKIAAQLANNAQEDDIDTTNEEYILATLSGRDYVEYKKGTSSKLPKNLQSPKSLKNVLLQNTEEKRAFALFDQAVAAGLQPNVITYSSLLSTMAKCGSRSDPMVPKRVEVVFNEMRSRGIEPDAVSWGILIHTWTRCTAVFSDGVLNSDQPDLKQKVKQDITTRSISQDTTNISTTDMLPYATKEEKVEMLLNDMLTSGCCPNSATFTALQTMWADSQRPDAGTKMVETFQLMHSLGVQSDTIGYSSLLSVLSKSKDINLVPKRAMEVFDSMLASKLPTDTMAWTILLGIWCRSELPEKAERVKEIFERMREYGVRPNGVTYSTLLTMWTHYEAPQHSTVTTAATAAVVNPDDAVDTNEGTKNRDKSARNHENDDSSPNNAKNANERQQRHNSKLNEPVQLMKSSNNNPTNQTSTTAQSPPTSILTLKNAADQLAAENILFLYEQIKRETVRLDGIGFGLLITAMQRRCFPTEPHLAVEKAVYLLTSMVNYGIAPGWESWKTVILAGSALNTNCDMRSRNTSSRTKFLNTNNNNYYYYHNNKNNYNKNSNREFNHWWVLDMYQQFRATGVPGAVQLSEITLDAIAYACGELKQSIIRKENYVRYLEQQNSTGNYSVKNQANSLFTTTDTATGNHTKSSLSNSSIVSSGIQKDNIRQLKMKKTSDRNNSDISFSLQVWKSVQNELKEDKLNFSILLNEMENILEALRTEIRSDFFLPSVPTTASDTTSAVGTPSVSTSTTTAAAADATITDSITHTAVNVDSAKYKANNERRKERSTSSQPKMADKTSFSLSSKGTTEDLFNNIEDPNTPTATEESNTSIKPTLPQAPSPTRVSVITAKACAAAMTALNTASEAGILPTATAALSALQLLREYMHCNRLLYRKAEIKSHTSSTEFSISSSATASSPRSSQTSMDSTIFTSLIDLQLRACYGAALGDSTVLRSDWLLNTSNNRYAAYWTVYNSEKENKALDEMINAMLERQTMLVRRRKEYSPSMKMNDKTISQEGKEKILEENNAPVKPSSSSFDRSLDAAKKVDSIIDSRTINKIGEYWLALSCGMPSSSTATATTTSTTTSSSSSSSSSNPTRIQPRSINFQRRLSLFHKMDYFISQLQETSKGRIMNDQTYLIYFRLLANVLASMLAYTAPTTSQSTENSYQVGSPKISQDMKQLSLHLNSKTNSVNEQNDGTIVSASFKQRDEFKKLLPVFIQRLNQYVSFLRLKPKNHLHHLSNNDQEKRSTSTITISSTENNEGKSNNNIFTNNAKNHSSKSANPTSANNAYTTTTATTVAPTRFQRITRKATVESVLQSCFIFSESLTTTTTTTVNNPTLSKPTIISMKNNDNNYTTSTATTTNSNSTNTEMKSSNVELQMKLLRDYYKTWLVSIKNIDRSSSTTNTVNNKLNRKPSNSYYRGSSFSDTDKRNYRK